MGSASGMDGFGRGRLEVNLLIFELYGWDGKAIDLVDENRD